jgi:ABC-type Fe3+-hydroxamate transport system substrate-binding protein
VRVVSLVPSVTETLLAWDVDVVACTRFCEQPALLHVGGTKDPDIAAIVALAPDLVVVDREENRREAAVALEDAGLDVHVTHVTSLDDVGPMLVELAAAVGATVVHEPATATRSLATQRAVIAIWRRPWMALGSDTYGSSLLASIGADNVVGAGERYPTIDLADLASRRPELIVLPSEPYPFATRHVPEVQRAVPDARVVLVDGRDLFWWGVRTGAARQRLAEVLSGPAS